MSINSKDPIRGNKPVKRKRSNAGQRMKGHDYRARCIYHIIMNKADYIPAFSHIIGELDSHSHPPYARKTELGEIISRCLTDLKNTYPFISVTRRSIMPDHIHFALYVKERSEYHLGDIIYTLKIKCFQEGSHLLSLPSASLTALSSSSHAASLTALSSASHAASFTALSSASQAYLPSDVAPDSLSCAPVSIFLPGYYDVIIRDREQLPTMLAYISDNPRRLLIRKRYPGWFRRFSIVNAAGERYSAYGNWDLLAECDKNPVKVSSKYSADELRIRKRGWYHTVMNCGVLVSPFISETEKNVRNWAEDHEGNIIYIVNEEFDDRYKPKGKQFELCEEGRMMLVSVPNLEGEGELTRSHCLRMNNLAERIASGEFSFEI